jgi:hypothetical protein
MNKRNADLPVFVFWTGFLDWLLPTTARFPKRARFSFAQRIEALALDVVEQLVEARYSREKTPQLQRINLLLEKMRVLLRISQKQQYLSYKQYEYAVKQLNETGGMVGSWHKQQTATDKA